MVDLDDGKYTDSSEPEGFSTLCSLCFGGWRSREEGEWREGRRGCRWLLVVAGLDFLELSKIKRLPSSDHLNCPSRPPDPWPPF
jgi:hypothetical protein